ncbi:hypothetical protein QBC35DRAFT_270746 [Podospora australis]|uniref:Uncharacterized protein n=1 Tax=Podospora australis TaxID=1536484 RepID=A0AAN6WR15_9PEZI|nr:hypothetical protein QBC35DRAFT_270746 [Podospora australis]
MHSSFASDFCKRNRQSQSTQPVIDFAKAFHFVPRNGSECRFGCHLTNVSPFEVHRSSVLYFYSFSGTILSDFEIISPLFSRRAALHDRHSVAGCICFFLWYVFNIPQSPSRWFSSASAAFAIVLVNRPPASAALVHLFVAFQYPLFPLVFVVRGRSILHNKAIIHHPRFHSGGLGLLALHVADPGCPGLETCHSSHNRTFGTVPVFWKPTILR